MPGRSQREGTGAWTWFLRHVDSNALLVIALSLFAWAPLVGPPYFLNAHDAPHSIFFLNQFDQAIRDGMLYPRWGVDFALGYGYPLFNIYSTLAFYVAEVFVLLGAGLTAAVKITYVGAFMISGLTMYAFAKRVLGPRAGLVAGAVYMFVPYRLLDIYVRSAFAEFCAFSLLPLVLLLFHDLAHRRSSRALGLATLAYAAVFLTHAATALLFTMLLVPYAAFMALTKVRRSWSSVGRLGGLYVGAAILAVAVAAIFILPMLAEKGYVVEKQWTQGSFEYAKHFVYPSQFFSPFWGYGYAGQGLADEMSLQLGLAAVVLALMGAVYALGRLVAAWPQVAFFLAASLVVIGAMMPVAQPLWELLPLAAFVQFPWRLLGLAALTTSFLSGAAVHGLTRASPADRAHFLDARAAVLVLVVVLASHDYTVPQYTAPSARSEQSVAIIDFETFYPPDRVGMTAWAEEQPQESPLVEQYLSGEPLVKAVGLAEGMQVQMINHSASGEEVHVTSPEGGEVRFYTYYYPGWRGYVDGRQADIYAGGPHGLITIEVPPGEHQVSVRFGDTPVRVAGTIITVASLAAAVVLIVSPWGRRGRLT